MSLNIFPRRDTRPQSQPVAEPPLQPGSEDTDSTEQATNRQDGADSSGRRRASRSRRGGSGRSSSSTSTATTETRDDGAATQDAEAEQDDSSSGTSSRSRSRSGGRSASSSRSGSRKSASTGEDGADDESGSSSKKASASRSSSSRSKSGSTDDESGEEESTRSRSSRSRSRKKSDDDGASGDTMDSAAIVKALETQTKQIEELTKTVKDFMKNNGGGQVAAPPVRVGVFVDVANVELGADRAKVKLHWGKILNLLSKDRQLVRAMAYAPVHDDPDVSRETQRFVEPFLDNGYKIVTKHLKRFSDGTIKANVDIEMTLDILNMLDRLDVVCLVSGDGDFEPLVQAAQDRGVRVEVVAMGNSCSNQLRAVSDEFIDLQQRLSQVKA